MATYTYIHSYSVDCQNESEASVLFFTFIKPRYVHMFIFCKS